MAEIILKAETGRPTGSRASGRLRASGKIPATVYGAGRDPVSVAVPWRELRSVLTTEAGLNALIELDIEGDSSLAMVKELQRHPVRRDVLHVDFVRVRRDQAVTVDVPITLTGEPTNVLQADGVVEQLIYSISISAKPADIPNELTLDISALSVGDSIRVGQLPVTEGVVINADPEEPVVAGQASATAADLEAADEEAAEAAAEEAGEPAEEEGEAPAEEGEDTGGDSTDQD